MCFAVGIAPLIFTVQVLSALVLAFGIWAFVVHGGPQITAAGLACASTGAFVGYAGLWWSTYNPSALAGAFLAAIAAPFFVIVLTYHLYWWHTQQAVAIRCVDPDNSKWSINNGFWIAFLGLAGQVSSAVQLFPVASALTTVGILMIAIGLSGRSRKDLVSAQSLLFVMLLSLYFYMTFRGFGRLTVIVLLASLGLVFTARSTGRVVKWVAILAVPIGAEVLTRLRSVILHGQVLEAAPDVADSDVGGVAVFQQLIELGDRLDFAWGSTLFATLVLPVPRELWAEKPFGFGFELTLLFLPEYASAGHSMVATFFGEWYYNFGWWGFPCLMVLFGPAVRWIDRKRSTYLSSPPGRRESILEYVFYITCAAGMLNLIWSGTHTFMARAIWIAAVLIVMGLVYRSLEPERAPHIRRPAEWQAR